MTGGGVIVRSATEADLDAVAEMVGEMVKGHPAENQPRPREDLRSVYLGNPPLAHLLVACRDGEVVGMGQWNLIYEMFWSKLGGHGEWLYVKPERRGHGIAAAIIAEICSRVRAAGGEFLRGGADEPHITELYNRATAGGTSSIHYLGGPAFEAMACLAGKPRREIARNLPDAKANSREG